MTRPHPHAPSRGIIVGLLVTGLTAAIAWNIGVLIAIARDVDLLVARVAGAVIAGWM